MLEKLLLMEYNKSEEEKKCRRGLLIMEKVQGGNARLLSNLSVNMKEAAKFIKKLQEVPEKTIWMIEIEYYCNNCNRYFDAESQGFGYPTCPYCGSDNVSDF